MDLEHEKDFLNNELGKSKKEIESLNEIIENLKKENEDLKNHQLKLDEYLVKATDIIKGQNERLLAKQGKVIKVADDKSKSSQKIGLKSGAKNSKIIEKVKEI